MTVASKLTQITLPHDFDSTMKYTSRTEHLRLIYERNPELCIAKGSSGLEYSAPDALPALLAHSSIPEDEIYLGKDSDLEHDLNQPPSGDLNQSPLGVTGSKVKTLKCFARGLGESQAWKRLILDTSDYEESMHEVEIWCQRYKENTVIGKRSPYNYGERYHIDKFPNWTKGQPAKYLEVKPKCLNCAKEEWPWKRFIPVEGIPSIDMDHLRRWANRNSFLSLDTAIQRPERLLQCRVIVLSRPNRGSASVTQVGSESVESLMLA